jgi:hypothetical protein
MASRPPQVMANAGAEKASTGCRSMKALGGGAG